MDPAWIGLVLVTLGSVIGVLVMVLARLNQLLLENQVTAKELRQLTSNQLSIATSLNEICDGISAAHELLDHHDQTIALLSLNAEDMPYGPN